MHGGKCDKCGVDFMKYAMTLLLQDQVQTERTRERQKEQLGLLKQALLLPITGGFGLIKYFRKRFGKD